MPTDARSVYISFDQGESSESVLVTPVAERQYRLEVSPIFSTCAVRFHDIIETAPQGDGSLHFLRVVERSLFHTFNFLLAKEVVESGQFRELLDRILALGGNWEIVAGGIVLLHIPKDVELDPAKLVKKIVKDLS